MAIRNDHDDYNWVFSGKLRQSPHRSDEYRSSRRLGDSIVELTLMAAGFAGVVLMITAVLGTFR